jgi:DNA-binding cell septation regulator SpoVG
MCVILRLDSVIDRVFILDEIGSELLFITMKSTRDAFLHNRDMVHSVCGNYRAVMLWVLLTCDMFKNVIERKHADKNIFTDDPICDPSVLEDAFNMDDDISLEDVEREIQLHNTHDVIAEYQHVNNKIEILDFEIYYGVPRAVFHQRILTIMSKILREHNIKLSENKSPPLHSEIVRDKFP